MTFKKTQPESSVPDSPEKLFLDLPRRKFPDVLPHQLEIMKTYAIKAVNLSDVALQLPTGSGKTLVGLLIAEWRRRKFKERVVYLAPTRQLANQVVAQGEEKYGLTVRGFVGSQRDYDPTAKAEYRGADRVAVTTYSSLFNTSPFFNDADVIILDDAHSAENYIASLWSVRVERNNPEHAALHAALCAILKPLLDSFNYTRLIGDMDTAVADRTWIDKLPTPVFSKILHEISSVLDAHVDDTDLSYSWSMIREHLEACHMYLSSQEILLRPLIPPTWTHPAFSNPKQRIYMSATLGKGGDLERLVGRSNIERLPVSKEWDRQGVGRRFFIFPGMSLDEDQVRDFRHALMKRVDRSLVLVPNNKLREEITTEVQSKLALKIFGSEDIEDSKHTFVGTKKAAAIVANRYDGIDFPGDECRLLIIEGLPRAMNLQEKFLMSRMGANALFNERVQTRVLQAIGRCTRSLEDFSAVVVTGEELPDYLADISKRRYLHPDLQAELSFGVEQSKDVTAKALIENFETFLRNDAEWEKANEQIVTSRKKFTQQPFPGMDELAAAVKDEIDYEAKIWQGDFQAAVSAADRVLGVLKAQELRGYRALWHYLAGSAAFLGAAHGQKKLLEKAQDEFSRAKDAAPNVRWLVTLSNQPKTLEIESPDANTIALEQVERMESVLANLGTAYDRSYANREKIILEGLASSESGLFENAHKLLGEMLGYDSGKEESDGSPDPWWIDGKICFVFEDHSGASVESSVDVKKARQAATHPNWIRKNVPGTEKAEIISVLITPALTAKEGAIPHLVSVVLWPLEEFRKNAREALSSIRKLRSTFVQPGDLAWRSDAVSMLKKNGLDAVGLMNRLKKCPADKNLKKA